MALTTDQASRLATLKAAYDSIIIGGNVVHVQSVGGRMVQYGPGNASLLKQEIDALEAIACLPSGASVRRRGALRFSVR